MFTDNIKKPLFVMAPMADVTDAAFREMFAEYGKPDITWTEFVSADGLFLAPEQGREFWLPEDLRRIAVEHGIASDNPLLKDLIYGESERPIIAQFFSRDPGRMERAAALAVSLGFDGVDINMGCPARVIVNQGAGCAMIRDPEAAVQVVRAAQKGASGKIPVGVKTRTGFASDAELDSWMETLLKENVDILTLHARTRKDMSKVPARWENIQRLVEMRDKINPKTIVIGNGDVNSLQEAKSRLVESRADGIMVGRGIFGNPWLFNKEVNKEDLELKTITEALIRHLSLFDKYLSDTKNFSIMKKHFKAYLSGHPNTKPLRQELMETNSSDEAIEVLKKL